jgi:hypothetical protein
MSIRVNISKRFLLTKEKIGIWNVKPCTLFEEWLLTLKWRQHTSVKYYNNSTRFCTCHHILENSLYLYSLLWKSHISFCWPSYEDINIPYSAIEITLPKCILTNLALMCYLHKEEILCNYVEIMHVWPSIHISERNEQISIKVCTGNLHHKIWGEFAFYVHQFNICPTLPKLKILLYQFPSLKQKTPWL